MIYNLKMMKDQKDQEIRQIVLNLVNIYKMHFHMKLVDRIIRSSIVSIRRNKR
jgi:hypothetical protein